MFLHGNKKLMNIIQLYHGIMSIIKLITQGKIKYKLFIVEVLAGRKLLTSKIGLYMKYTSARGKVVVRLLEQSARRREVWKVGQDGPEGEG